MGRVQWRRGKAKRGLRMAVALSSYLSIAGDGHSQWQAEISDKYNSIYTTPQFLFIFSPPILCNAVSISYDKKKTENQCNS